MLSDRFGPTRNYAAEAETRSTKSRPWFRRARGACPGLCIETGPIERLTLHTKAAVADREVVFVGSLNLDPRSIELNTEMGLFLHSTIAAMAFAEPLDAALAEFTYRLALGTDGAIEWHHQASGRVTTAEPEAGSWREFQLGLHQLLPIENQL